MRKLSTVVAGTALAGVVLVVVAWPSGSPADAPRDCVAARSDSQARLDLRRSLGRETRFVREFDYRAMYPATGVDAIPSIDHPCHERPEQAVALPGSSLVLGVDHGGEARAYPVDLLSLHEVVNDVVGGLPAAVTWCPLCANAVAYDRRVGSGTLTFGISGYLYRANLMLFDRETGSLWTQLLGGAVTGRMRVVATARHPARDARVGGRGDQGAVVGPNGRALRPPLHGRQRADLFAAAGTAGDRRRRGRRRFGPARGSDRRRRHRGGAVRGAAGGFRRSRRRGKPRYGQDGEPRSSPCYPPGFEFGLRRLTVRGRRVDEP